jgi:hypothetical protein
VDASLFNVETQQWKDCMETMKQGLTVDHVWQCDAIRWNVEWYTCGSNCRGQLGLGHNEKKVLSWTRVSFPVPFVSIACGYHHTLALDEEGGVWAWGQNCAGQLGLGHNNDCYSPQKVAFFGSEEKESVRMISAAFSLLGLFSAAVTGFFL